jgi:hypothetical protein
MSNRAGESRQLCECGCGEPAPIADRTAKRFGWVKGEPKRFINGHNRRKSSVDYIEEDRGHETPCWIWQRSLNNRGYGLTARGSQTGRMRAAHRYYYEERFGAIPEGKQLDHLCRVPACVNPDHLEPVTAAINRQRGDTVQQLVGWTVELHTPQPDGSVEEHFVGAYRELDHRVLRDARKYTAPGYDLAAELEKLEDERDRDFEHEQAERTGEIGERLAHAVRTDLGERKHF